MPSDAGIVEIGTNCGVFSALLQHQLDFLIATNKISAVVRVDMFMHMKDAMYPLVLLTPLPWENFSKYGPAKSIPECIKARVEVKRLAGKSAMICCMG